MYRKNVAGQFIFFTMVVIATGAPDTGATVTVKMCIDNAAQATGGGTVTHMGGGQYKYAMAQADTNGNNISYFFTATGDYPVEKTIVTTAADPTDAVRFGLSALPNTACTTNASLLTSGTGTDQLSVAAGKVLLQATQTGVTIPTVTTVTNQLTAAQIATAQWQDATVGDFTVAGSIGKSLFTAGNAPGAASGLALVGSNMGSASSVTGAVGSVTGSVGSVVGNVGGSVASVTGAVGSVAGNVGGSVASVVGAVGSVTGNLGGNVVGSVGSVVGAVGSVTGAVGSVTGSVGSVVGNVGGSVASVTGSVGSVAGNVNGTVGSVVDLSVTALAESSAVPAATATPLQKLNFLATIARNKITQTSTTQLLRNDADTATIGTATVSDDGTTGIRGKFS
jgi:hypothetical protein